jgi:ribonucleoside-diphosphate reductase alpha chain
MNIEVVKRDGETVTFDRQKIENAIEKAYVGAGKVSMYGIDKAEVTKVVDLIISEVVERFSDNEIKLNVENLHDIVEKHLMRNGNYEVAKSYILYRAQKRQKESAERKKVSFLKSLTVTKKNGAKVAFNPKKLKETIRRHSEGLQIDQQQLFFETVKNVYDEMKSEDVEKALVMSATAFIEQEPDYSILASRFFRQKLAKEVFGKSVPSATRDWQDEYRKSFVEAINLGTGMGMPIEFDSHVYDERLVHFDLKKLSDALAPERDELLKYIGIHTLYERYFVRLNKRCLEMPQTFWMRVAMGLAINEEDKTDKAIEFYDVMSQLLYIPSTPTLFHSGLLRPQLSSCFLTTVEDDLKHIFQAYSDNAQMSKWSGGIGNDWTPVRSTGAIVNTTNVESQGVIPFLKIANDGTVAISRSGKRRGATVAYLETWHLDIEDFLDLRKNTGDERRRTPDMNTANWIPDIFMKRVRQNDVWTLFSPDEVPDLHDLYGKKFDERYCYYEQQAKLGYIKKFKVLEAVKLYRKMITMLFETGHPWVCWKCPANIRSPQDHIGVIHSSNLCTEIELNTKATKRDKNDFSKVLELGEVAVCVLGSINLYRLMQGVDTDHWKVDWDLVKKTIHTAMRMLDNVIDINFYPIPEARHSNLKHRPVGLGFMGLQDALFLADIRYEEADDFVDELQEFISYQAISASCKLAEERGTYETYKGSKWDRGIFPLDTIDILEKERGVPVEVDRRSRLDWDSLKKLVSIHGVRNSNMQAIAPTATISGIGGVLGACGESTFKNLFTKANMSGEFTVINEFLVNDLKKEGLWNKDMLDQIKFHNGSVQKIDKIPVRLRTKYKEAFEIDQKRSIDLTALRAKWIDQSQSHNVFFAGNSGKALADIYMHAWKKGLKTTYYLRTLGASGVEKSTLDAAKYGLTQKRTEETIPTVKVCRIDDPTCESCQ